MISPNVLEPLAQGDRDGLRHRFVCLGSELPRQGDDLVGLDNERHRTIEYHPRRFGDTARSLSVQPFVIAVRTSEHPALIFSVASSSPLVAPRFTIATGTPVRRARRTNRRPDMTVN